MKTAIVIDPEQLNYSQLISNLIDWFLAIFPPVGIVDFILDAAKFSLASIRNAIAQDQNSPQTELEDVEDLTERNLLSMLNANISDFSGMGIDLSAIMSHVNSGMNFKNMLQSSPADRYDWRENSEINAWVLIACKIYVTDYINWTEPQVKRLWQLIRWIDEPKGTVPYYLKDERGGYIILSIANQSEGQIRRCRPSLIQIIVAFKANAVTEADLLDCIIGERFGVSYYQFSELKILTQRDRTRNEFSNLPKADYQYLLELVDRCRNRILEIESDRGDLPTPATEAALSLQSILGIPPVIKLLQNLGKEQFIRGWSYDRSSKAGVFSHLIRVSFPTPTDTPELFAQQMREAGISNQKAIAFAVYAPQWARYVEHLLECPLFAEAVWWFHAHTKDSHWEVEQSIREGWSAQVGEHTPLTSQDLVDGAVDVTWFWRVYKAMTPTQWEEIHEAAKFAAGGQGHTRAKLFAEAMLGQIQKSATCDRIQKKRHQDSVRALGLIPLDQDNREADILQRYEVIQEFIRGSKQFGSQRQASEKLAARIAMENLARTAGYADPQRLEWAMEAKAIADLVAGAVTVTEGDISVSLSLLMLRRRV